MKKKHPNKTLKKKSLWLLVILGTVALVTLFHRTLLQTGIDLALHMLLPKTAISYEEAAWERNHLVLRGIQVEDQEVSAAAGAARLAFKLNLYPFYLQTHVTFENPELVLRHQSTAPAASFAALIPSKHFGLKVDVPKGSLLLGEEHLYFSLTSGEGRSQMGSLCLSYDPNLAGAPLLVMDLEVEKEWLMTNFEIPEIECAQVISLVSALYPEIKEGWEHVEGSLATHGKAVLSLPCSLAEISGQISMRQVRLANSQLKVEADVEDFQSDFTYPIFQEKEESAFQPFWKQIAATLSVKEGRASFGDWGVFAQTATMALEPESDPSLSLNGSLLHRDKEYPLELEGRGFVNDDHSFWLELIANSEGEEAFFSLCSSEENAHIFQADLKNIPSRSWTLVREFFDVPLRETGEEAIGGKFTGWIKEGLWQRVQVENFHAQNLSFTDGSALKEANGEAYFVKTETQGWQISALLLDLFQGSFKGAAGDLHLDFSQKEPRSSWFKGRWAGIEGEVLGELKREALGWELRGSAGFGENGAIEFSYSWKEGWPIGERAQGWLRSERINLAHFEKLFPASGDATLSGTFRAQQVELNLHVKDFAFSNARFECASSLPTEIKLHSERLGSEWKGSALLSGAVLREKKRDLLFEDVGAKIYFDQKSIQASVHEMSLALSDQIQLKNFSGELDLNLETERLHVHRGYGTVLYADKLRTRLLLSYLSLDAQRLEGDLSLLDDERELVRLLGEGTGSKFLFKPGTHLLDVKPSLFVCEFDEEKALRSLDLQFTSKTENLLSAIQFLNEKEVCAIDLSLFDPFKGQLLTSQIHQEGPKTRFSIQVDGKERLCEGEKSGALWTIHKFQWDEWQAQGSFAYEAAHLKSSSFEVKKKGFSCKGEGLYERETGDFAAKVQIVPGNSSEFFAESTGRFLFSTRAGVSLENLSIKLHKGSTFSTARLDFNPRTNEGSTAPISFALDAGWLGMPLQGVATLRFSQEIYGIEGTLQEGRYELAGKPWECKQIAFSLDPKLCNVSAETAYEGHPLWVSLGIDRTEKAAMMAKIQENPELPGLRIFFVNSLCESIQGSLFGLEADFAKKASSLLAGTLQVDVHRLSEILPKEVKKQLQPLKAGKGFLFSGQLHLPEKETSFAFHGNLYGKDFDLLGYRLEEMESEIEIHPERIKLSQLQVHDSCGSLSIPQLKLIKGGSWSFEIPLIQVLDFHPSRLRLSEGIPGPVKPFFIPHLSLMDVRGDVEDFSTLTGIGTFDFANQIKKEAHFLDQPLELLKNLGLDSGLFTPISGEVECRLRGDKLYFVALKNTFSEGERSQFYLAAEESPSFLSLNGQLHIDLKMRQSVLLKFTEPLTLKIRGTLEKPSYSIIP